MTGPERDRRRYIRLRTAAVCVLCREPLPAERIGRVDCLECARMRTLKQRERKQSACDYTCGRCGELGHNRRTCVAPQSSRTA